MLDDLSIMLIYYKDQIVYDTFKGSFDKIKETEIKFMIEQFLLIMYLLYKNNIIINIDCLIYFHLNIIY